MKCRNILTVATLTGAALTASAMAQTTIYTNSFDNPPYTVGSIDAQQSWVTAQAAALAPGLTSMAISATAGSLAPQAGNGCFFSQNGDSATTSGRFAFQAGVGTPVVDAINTACAASATSIEEEARSIPSLTAVREMERVRWPSAMAKTAPLSLALATLRPVLIRP